MSIEFNQIVSEIRCRLIKFRENVTCLYTIYYVREKGGNIFSYCHVCNNLIRKAII